MGKDLSRYRHLHVSLADDEGANLLAHLPACYGFVAGALDGYQQAMQAAGYEDAGGAEDGDGLQGPQDGAGGGGGQQVEPSRVLVHCQAGVSRSVSGSDQAVVRPWLGNGRAQLARAAWVRGLRNCRGARAIRGPRQCQWCQQEAASVVSWPILNLRHLWPLAPLPT